mmetsp:Transcript_45397/g.72593  ORF Transcript_45397/g.72593 Transcript_45397/m.72593 type:complete len:82 (+) Transcript_45397:141-386(+)
MRNCTQNHTKKTSRSFEAQSQSLFHCVLFSSWILSAETHHKLHTNKKQAKAHYRMLYKKRLQTQIRQTAIQSDLYKNKNKK